MDPKETCGKCMDAYRIVDKFWENHPELQVTKLNDTVHQLKETMTKNLACTGNCEMIVEFLSRFGK